MTELVILPHVQRLLIHWLLTQPEVTDIVGQSVVSEMSPKVDQPAVRVTSFPGRIVSGGSIYWLESTLLQVDCWGGPAATTHRLAETVRAVTSQRFVGSITAGGVSAVVTGVDPGGIADDSDESYKPARPLARFDLMVTAHPEPTPGS